jgi:hypothetical protein
MVAFALATEAIMTHTHPDRLVFWMTTVLGILAWLL